MKELNFDTLEPQGVEFTYKGKRYVLREAPEATVIKYKSVITANARFDANGKPTEINVGGMVGLNALLVAGCSFEQLTDRHGKPTGEERAVSESTVQSWPNSMVVELAAEAERLTPNLKGDKDDAEAEGAEKNAPAATRNGSTSISASATS